MTAALAALLRAGSATGQDEVRPGPWRRADCPDGWVLQETPHYQVQSQAGADKAERLGRHMEAMLQVYRQLFRSDKGSFRRYTIKLFRDRRAFLGYGASATSGAYYDPGARELVCYDTGVWMDAVEVPTDAKGQPLLPGRRYELDILGAVAHEGWHQYFHWYVTSRVEIPPWIDEGLGDYFYCAVPRTSGGRSQPAQLGRLNDMRLPVVWSAIKQGKQLPLTELLSLDKRRFYAGAGLCYAQAWALCHFLLHSGDKAYAEVIPRFVRYVRDDTNMAQVTERAFRGIDMQQLEADFHHWVLEEAIRELWAKRAEAGEPEGETDRPKDKLRRAGN